MVSYKLQSIGALAFYLCVLFFAIACTNSANAPISDTHNQTADTAPTIVTAPEPTQAANTCNIPEDHWGSGLPPGGKLTVICDVVAPNDQEYIDLVSELERKIKTGDTSHVFEYTSSTERKLRANYHESITLERALQELKKIHGTGVTPTEAEDTAAALLGESETKPVSMWDGRFDDSHPDQLSHDNVASILADAGWPDEWIPWGLCITSHESQWIPSAVSPENHNGTRDYGLWQINAHWFDGRFATFDLFSLASRDPLANSKQALIIFNGRPDSGPAAWSTRHYCEHLEPA